MRIACYGLVERDAGSVASANFLVLEELLRRGHAIDFYAKSDFVRAPEALMSSLGFSYHGVLLEKQRAWRDLVSPAWGGVANRLAEEWLLARHLDAISARLAEAHRQDPYDALLFLGVEPQFTAPADLPVVSWLQGPPQTEWEVLARLRKQIVRLAGYTLYAKLWGFYAYKKHCQRRRLAQADHLVCGSKWACRQIVRFGVPAGHVHALPYPFDLDLFAPQPGVEPLHPGRHTLLWLGRIDPRKRLDLMLAAFRRLVERRQDVHLEIVGRLSYAPEYQALIDAFPYPEHLTYRSHVDRADVPALMRASSLLVQPSEHENFGSSVAEALACGTPVVVGPTNGTGEFCGAAAFRFDAYTPAALEAALAEGLGALTRDADAVARTARAAAEQHFDPSAVVGRLVHLLQAGTLGAAPSSNGSTVRSHVPAVTS